MSAPVHRLRLAVVILALIAGLVAFDFALANTVKTEIGREAEEVFTNGQNALRAGNTAAALESLRRAHFLQRTNESYALGLVEALLANGNNDEAAALLDSILQTDPNDGRANLFMARLMLKTGRFPESQPYFHRAIYGQWHESASGHRVQARLELVQALAAANRTADLLPELLPLESEAWNDSSVLQQVANYYLIAGSPNRSAQTLRELIRREPRNSSLYENLGRGELAIGNFPSAQRAFLTAFKYNPNDGQIRKGMELSSALSALDPTPRKLRTAEKDQRSRRILELAREEAQTCAAQPGLRAEDSQRIQDRLKQSDSQEQEVTNERSEEKLTEAEAVWKVLQGVCGSNTSLKWNELNLIMRKLAQ